MRKKQSEKRINSNKLLTIVTIANSNISELNKTYKNLRESLYLNEELVEWILILSGDFKGLENKIYNSHKNVRVFHQEPKGIYYAMNTAINLANGTYSWFINAGDDIVSKKLSKLIEILKFSGKDLNFFSVIIQDRNGEEKEFKSLYKYNDKLLSEIQELKMPIHHQGIIYKSKILKKYLYDENFKIRGDYENLLRLIKLKKDLSISSHNVLISIFYEGGVSNKKFIHFESLKALKKNSALKLKSFLFFIYFFLKFFLINFFIRILKKFTLQKNF